MLFDTIYFHQSSLSIQLSQSADYSPTGDLVNSDKEREGGGGLCLLPVTCLLIQKNLYLRRRFEPELGGGGG